MSIKGWIAALAIFTFGIVAFAFKANAQQPVQVSYSKAGKAGVATCPAKYKATRAVSKQIRFKKNRPKPALGTSFQHGLTGQCYSCPTGYKRSLNPNIKAKDACVRGLPGRTLNSKATYRGKVKARKPAGTFFDPRNGGEYWSCRRGTHRTVFPVTSNKACERRAKTYYKRASKYRKNSRVGQGCPRGKFWDVKGGNGLLGACYSCPGGYRRSASSVTSSKACYRKVGIARYKAKKHGKVTNPRPRGAFLDPRKGGEYWSCPAGYKRSVVPVTSAKACVRVILPRTLKSVATYRGKKGCPRGAFQNGVFPECYYCPKGYKRSLAVGRDLSRMRNACVKVKVDLSGGARALAWMKKEIAQIRRQVEPEMAAAVNVMRRNQKLVQALLKAKSDKQRAAIARRIGDSVVATMRKRKRASLDLIDPQTIKHGPRIQLASAGKIPPQLALIPKNVKFQTTSVAIVADVSYGIGATLTPVMVAQPIFPKPEHRGKKVFHHYNAVAGSVGFTAGADGAGEVGLWVDDYKSLAGGSMGGVAGVTAGAGGSLTYWWNTDKPHKFLGMTFTIATGTSAELKFTAGTTWLRKDLNAQANQR